jgi:ABC-type Mn2+/Zn2+ transport system ATPase subunit
MQPSQKGRSSLRYISFNFRNFKGIEEMRLDLSGDVTTLIGPNKSGKTTILEAISCFSYGVEDLEVTNPSTASLRAPEQWIPISRRANFNDTIEIRAYVELSDEDKKAFRAHMFAEFGLSLADVPAQIEISEKYRFEHSRYINTDHLWKLTVRGTTGRQRNPRGYASLSDEWQGAVNYLKGRLPRIWYFPNFLLMMSFGGRDRAGSRSLILLDEPASNLDPSVNDELLKSFEELGDKSCVVYTTHGQHLINVPWLDSAYVVKNVALGSLDIDDYLAMRMAPSTSISATRYWQFVLEHPDQTF